MWTRTTPTQPGWYWWRELEARNGVRFTRIVEIERVGDVLLVSGIGTNMFLVENASGDWQRVADPVE